MPLSFRRSQAAEEEARPEWNLSKISVGGDAGGLIVTLAIIGIAFVALPPARWFLAAVLPVGVIVALILRFTACDRD